MKKVCIKKKNAEENKIFLGSAENIKCYLNFIPSPDKSFFENTF